MNSTVNISAMEPLVPSPASRNAGNGRFVVGNPAWTKGVSGNPSGRVKSNLSSLLAKYVQKKAAGTHEKWESILVRRVVALAAQGDMDAMRFIWERMEGRIKDSGPESNHGPLSITLVNYAPVIPTPAAIE
jgi:hypothetical protein